MFVSVIETLLCAEKTFIMLTQTPRLLHAAALRETVYSMSSRLGYCGCVSYSPPGSCMRWALRTHSLRGSVRLPKAVHTRSFCVEGSSGQASSSSAAPSKIADEESAKSAVGRIDIIVGPMFAGKTSELLRRVEQHEAAGRKVAVVKSSVDTRYHATRVVSHDGKSKVCFAASSLKELRSQLGDEYHEYSVFAIDEAQFLPDLLEFCTTAADVDSKHVVIAGLDGDFKRQRFGQVLDIVSVADSVTKLAGKCAYCDRQALFSLRIAADKRQALVGGADKYAPVCRHHYVSLNNVRTLES